jgi:Fic-DOC domain mobile mystery protein B
MQIDYPEGSTPITPEDLEGLIPSHITTRAEIDRWEQENINEALAWVEMRKPKDILNESFMKTLHKRMFCHVWQWAGTFRQHETTIGVKVFQISSELVKLFGDVAYWLENGDLSEDEIAAQFHHRLVWIHLFPNGNGRHARLVTDTLLENVLHKPPFSWGRANLAQTGSERERYLGALRLADRYRDYGPLLEFVRS